GAGMVGPARSRPGGARARRRTGGGDAGRSSRRAGDGAADLLLAGHHRRRLHPALHDAARRAAAVPADGVYGCERAARLADTVADADPGVGDMAFPARREELGAPAAAVARRATWRFGASSAASRGLDSLRRAGPGGRLVPARPRARPRVPAAARRGRYLDSRQPAARHLAAKIMRGRAPDARRHQTIA